MTRLRLVANLETIRVLDDRRLCYPSYMGIFDDLKKKVQDKLAERAQEAAVEQSKAAAKAFAKKSVEQAKGLGKKIEEELFGPGPEKERESTPEERTRETGEKLRASAKSIADREEREARETKERAEKAAKVEREVDAELAALKARLKKP